MKIICGSCGASVDTAAPPHACAQDVTIARSDWQATQQRPQPSAPAFQPAPAFQAPPMVQPTPSFQPLSAPPLEDVPRPSQAYPTAQYATTFATEPEPGRFGTPAKVLPWVLLSAGVLLAAVFGLLLLRNRGAETDAVAPAETALPETDPASNPNPDVTDPVATASVQTSPVDTAPVITEPVAIVPAAAPATVPAVPVSVTPAPVAPAPIAPTPTRARTMPSASWDGEYRDAPSTGPLLIGHRGYRVKVLQDELVYLGLLSTLVDGYFGLDTEAAVIEFQRQSGLTQDGIAGDDTLAALDQSWNS